MKNMSKSAGEISKANVSIEIVSAVNESNAAAWRNPVENK
jgi:hypothetical protein